MNYFIVKSQYQAEDESGRLKTHNEQRLFQAISFTDAEASFSGFMHGEGHQHNHEVKDIRPAKFSDIGDDNGEYWFKAKGHYETESERTGKLKKTPVLILVNASDIKGATAEFQKLVDTWHITVMLDKIEETKIIDFVPAKKKE